ncbi:MAG TPA: hypothetical protein VGH27_12185 [Streptosporangiaceae bacterium]
MDASLTDAALRCARDRLGDVTLVRAEAMRDRPGWLVARLTLRTEDGERCVIAKTALPRERAALEVLAGARVPGVPRLLGACDDPALILMEDAGQGPTVAGHLMGGDPGRAAAAVADWAEALARVQAATLGRGAEFAARLDALTATAVPAMAPDVYRARFGTERAVPWKSAVTRPGSAEVSTDTYLGLRDGLAGLGVSVLPEALDGLRALAGKLRADPAGLAGPGALSPGDGCPDNNAETPGGLVLIDFEGADFRHVAWDAAYLTVPWPSCWCSWRMPEPVAAAALDRWRAVLEPALAPGVAASLADAVRAATVVWSLVTVAWFLDAAAADRPLGPGGAQRPGSRELVQHRLGVAADAGAGTVLGDLAARALAAARAAWGPRPLDLARAWRGR